MSLISNFLIVNVLLMREIFNEEFHKIIALYLKYKCSSCDAMLVSKSYNKNLFYTPNVDIAILQIYVDIAILQIYVDIAILQIYVDIAILQIYVDIAIL